MRVGPARQRHPLLSPCKGEIEAHFGGKACYCCGIGCGNVGPLKDVTAQSGVCDQVGLFVQ